MCPGTASKFAAWVGSRWGLLGSIGRQVGKQDNCRVAISLSVTTESAGMPVAYRLYLPEVWIKDSPRRKKTGVPKDVQFQTKPEIALEQIRQARERGLPQGVVLC